MSTLCSHFSTRRLVRAFAGLLAAGGASLPTAQGQACYNAGNLNVIFGAVGLGQTVDAVGTAPFRCQSNAQTTYFRVCLSMPEGPSGGSNSMSGINPRRMINYNGSGIGYTLYTDPARTQVLGPEGSGYPVYTTTFSVPGGYAQMPLNLNVYGRAGPISMDTPAGHYQAQFDGAVLRYAWSNSAVPADCQQPNSQTVHSFFATSANVSNSCVVNVSATDLDFGTIAPLQQGQIDATATITLSCPPNTHWQVGLDNGQHALGTQRRMAGPDGNHVPYELYRDSARTQRWGNTLDMDTYPRPANPTNPVDLTVHGRVEGAQTDVPPGSYSDTVTITVTY